MTVRLVNPHEVTFKGSGLPGCTEARLLVDPERIKRDHSEADAFDTHVEVLGVRYLVELDCEDVPAAVAVTPGQSGALSFRVNKADGSGTLTVSASTALVTGQRTRFRNQAEGLSLTTLTFECRSGSGVSVPVTMS